MKRMMTMLLMVGMCVTMVGCAMAEDGPAGAAHGNWFTDFAKAKEVAAAKSLPILMDFSGSDWCGWCIKLDREVFSQEAFVKYAEGSLVLFLADFPARKKLPDEVVKQNQALAEKYEVRGYPTVLLIDAKGDVIAQTGYQRGGADAYVAHIKKLLEK